jgi:hypothetical protein
LAGRSRARGGGRQGVKINSPHTLARFAAPPGPAAFTLVVSQYDKSTSLAFTLKVRFGFFCFVVVFGWANGRVGAAQPTARFPAQAYSKVPVTLAETPRLPREEHVDGAWAAATAGGSTNDAAAHARNPQFRLTVRAPFPGMRAVADGRRAGDGRGPRRHAAAGQALCAQGV